MTTTVLLVDDHPVVRSGLRAVLDAAETLQIVGEAATGEEALALAAHLRPDVVLCDLRLGNGIDGIQTTTALRALDPAPAVLILTTFDRDAEILGAIEAGAAATSSKKSTPTSSSTASSVPQPATRYSPPISPPACSRACAAHSHVSPTARSTCSVSSQPDRRTKRSPVPSSSPRPPSRATSSTSLPSSELTAAPARSTSRRRPA